MKTNPLQCQGKFIYQSRKDCWIDVQIRIAEARTPTVDIKAKKCKICNGWHIESK